MAPRARNRRQAMLRLTGKLAEQTQVLLFTCHEFMLRELAEAGCAYTQVALPSRVSACASA